MKGRCGRDVPPDHPATRKIDPAAPPHAFARDADGSLVARDGTRIERHGDEFLIRFPAGRLLHGRSFASEDDAISATNRRG